MESNINQKFKIKNLGRTVMTIVNKNYFNAKRTMLMNTTYRHVYKIGRERHPRDLLFIIFRFVFFLFFFYFYNGTANHLKIVHSKLYN